MIRYLDFQSSIYRSFIENLFLVITPRICKIKKTYTITFCEKFLKNENSKFIIENWSDIFKYTFFFARPNRQINTTFQAVVKESLASYVRVFTVQG